MILTKHPVFHNERYRPERSLSPRNHNNSITEPSILEQGTKTDSINDREVGTINPLNELS